MFELSVHDEDFKQQLEAQGWQAFRVFAAPAAGPRNFITMGLDEHLSRLHGSHSQSAVPGTWLWGGSMAALRHCGIVSQSLQMRSMGAAGKSITQQLVDAFTQMVYRPGDTGQVLAPMMRRLVDLVTPNPAELLSHPSLHLCIMVTQLKPWCETLPTWQLKLIFYGLLGINAVSSIPVNAIQQRLCFYSGPYVPPFLADDSSVTCIPLTTDNIHQVLHATTCLPFMSEHCTYIDGVGQGLFFDGALSDYQLNFHSSSDYPVLLLSCDIPPHSIKKTLWDTYSLRCVPQSMMRAVSVLSPTDEYKVALGTGRLPSTWEFFRSEYIADPQLRMDAWRRAYHLSQAFIPDHPVMLLTDSQSLADSVAGVMHSSQIPPSSSRSSLSSRDGESERFGKDGVERGLAARLGQRVWSWVEPFADAVLGVKTSHAWEADVM